MQHTTRRIARAILVPIAVIVLLIGAGLPASAAALTPPAALDGISLNW